MLDNFIAESLSDFFRCSHLLLLFEGIAYLVLRRNLSLSETLQLTCLSRRYERCRQTPHPAATTPATTSSNTCKKRVGFTERTRSSPIKAFTASSRR